MFSFEKKKILLSITCIYNMYVILCSEGTLYLKINNVEKRISVRLLYIRSQIYTSAGGTTCLSIIEPHLLPLSYYLNSPSVFFAHADFMAASAVFRYSSLFF